MKVFSSSWKSSKKPRKQRKYRVQAPLHIKKVLMSANLLKALREKFKRRSLPVRSGDSVNVLRGQFKNNRGVVERVDRSRQRVYITGVERVKRDGSKSLVPIHPSNLVITDVNVSDNKRKQKLEGKK